MKIEKEKVVKMLLLVLNYLILKGMNWRYSYCTVCNVHVNIYIILQEFIVEQL